MHSRSGRDCRAARGDDALDASDRGGQLALHDVPDLFLLMEVLVQWGRVGRDRVAGERHVLGVKEPPLPSRKRLAMQHLTRVDNGHGLNVAGRLAAVSVFAFVIVSGPPGSGKSTLARDLALRLGLPLFAKDTIKESLMDTLGVPLTRGEE